MIQLEIHDEEIYFNEIEVRKKMPLKSFLKQLVNNNTEFETPTLPNNCIKYKEQNGKKNYYVLIPKGNYKLLKNNKGYTVTLPNQVFVFSMNINDNNDKKVRLYWNMSNNKSIKGDNYCVPLIENTYDNGNICMGSYKIKEDPIEYIEEYITKYFTNNFNNDLTYNYKKGLINVSKEQEKMYKKGATEEELIKVWIKEGHELALYPITFLE